MEVPMLNELVEALQGRLARLPDGFFDSFEYTRTGNNLTHPIVVAALVEAVATLPRVRRVGVDVRLNDGEGKLQPDVVAFDADFEPVLLIDYESPNSSDARIPMKDWDPYILWRTRRAINAPPYVVVSTLPSKQSPGWELRYTSKGYYNHEFQGRRSEVCRNPFDFWYAWYRAQARSRNMAGICMLNVDADASVKAVAL
jgi:hypothetical protein